MPFTRNSSIIRIYFPNLSSMLLGRAVLFRENPHRLLAGSKEKAHRFFNTRINISDTSTGHRVIRNGKGGHNKCHRIDRKIEADPIKIELERS